MKIQRGGDISNFRTGGGRQIAYGIPRCLPSRKGRSFRVLQMRRLRRIRYRGAKDFLPTEDECPDSRLRRSIVSCIQQRCRRQKAKLFCPPHDLFVLWRPQQPLNIFNQKNGRIRQRHNVHVGLPKGTTRISVAGFVQKAETLTRRTANDDIRFRNPTTIADPLLNVSAYGMAPEVQIKT